MKLSLKQQFGMRTYGTWILLYVSAAHHTPTLCHCSKNLSSFLNCFWFYQCLQNLDGLFQLFLQCLLNLHPPSNFSHLSNTKPLPSSCHPDMINLRNFSSITAYNRLLGFSYLVSSHFHASPTLYCSTTVIYIYNWIHSFSTFSFWEKRIPSAVPVCVGGHDDDDSVCLKYIGKSSWLLDVKRVYREIVITISNTSTEQNQGSLAPSHTAWPLNLRMPLCTKKRLLWEMNHWKGARNTQQWITGCCTFLSNVIQAPTLADNERNQNWILAVTGQIQKSHVAALFPLLLLQRSELGPPSLPASSSEQSTQPFD